MLQFGLDLGGTKIEGVVLDSSGKILFRERVPTEQASGYDSILKNLKDLYEAMCREVRGRKHTLGLGTPGSISSKSGFLKNSNTICLNGKLTYLELKELFRHDVCIQNDANCFALAEALLGAGKGYQNVFGVIMGTGCGGGIVFDGKVLTGPQSIAGEWGHMSIDPEGPACYCGSKGCVETFISGGGLEKSYEEKNGLKKSLKDIVREFREGDVVSTVFMQEFFQNFGRAIANLINVLDPDVIVLGGGVSNIDELYSQGMKQVAARIFNDEMTTPIVQHQLGDSAGVLGAALVGI